MKGFDRDPNLNFNPQCFDNAATSVNVESNCPLWVELVLLHGSFSNLVSR